MCTQTCTCSSNLFTAEKVDCPVLKQCPPAEVWSKGDLPSIQVSVNHLWLVISRTGQGLTLTETLGGSFKPRWSDDRTTARQS